MTDLHALISEPRRLTPTERLHEITLAALQRRTVASASFQVKQVKAAGGAPVIEWDVQVPVCDEYPTAEKAFQASVQFAARLRAEYPPQNGAA